MIGRLRAVLDRGRGALSGPEARPSPPLYAIGDIHGRLDLLDPLLAEIRRDATSHERAIVVGLGDYVDRGADSRGVVDRLLELAEQPGIEGRFLRGNHDQLLLDFLEDPSLGPYWGRVGGGETLRSYGVEPPSTPKKASAWGHARDAFVQAMPERHLAFFQGLSPCFTWGDYFFAHAGAKPGTALEDQAEHDLLWIRAEFLEHEDRFDRIVVHGHTPAADAHADHRRVGLDTGAYMTGVLTACRFQGEGRRLIQAAERPDGPPEIRSRDI